MINSGERGLLCLFLLRATRCRGLPEQHVEIVEGEGSASELGQHGLLLQAHFQWVARWRCRVRKYTSTPPLPLDSEPPSQRPAAEQK
jgi:hypothetical protein